MIEIKGNKIILEGTSGETRFALDINKLNVSENLGQCWVWTDGRDFEGMEVKESFDDILKAIDAYYKSRPSSKDWR